MLINTISFEIHNVNAQIHEQFLIENTIDNQEKVFTHRYTRDIQFTQTFTFQFEKEMAMPIEFVEMDTWVRMLEMNPELIEVFA